jgi:hypothetical protein
MAVFDYDILVVDGGINGCGSPALRRGAATGCCSRK